MFQFVNPSTSCFGLPGFNSMNSGFNPCGPIGFNSVGGWNPWVNPSNLGSTFGIGGNSSWCGLPVSGFSASPIGVPSTLPVGASSWVGGVPWGIPGTFNGAFGGWTNGLNSAYGCAPSTLPFGCVPTTGFVNGIPSTVPVTPVGNGFNGLGSTSFCGPFGYAFNPMQGLPTAFGGTSFNAGNIPTPIGMTGFGVSPLHGSTYPYFVPAQGNYVNSGINGAMGMANGAPIGLHREAA